MFLGLTTSLQSIYRFSAAASSKRKQRSTEVAYHDAPKGGIEVRGEGVKDQSILACSFPLPKNSATRTSVAYWHRALYERGRRGRDFSTNQTVPKMGSA